MSPNQPCFPHLCLRMYVFYHISWSVNNKWGQAIKSACPLSTSTRPAIKLRSGSKSWEVTCIYMQVFVCVHVPVVCTLVLDSGVNLFSA